VDGNVRLFFSWNAYHKIGRSSYDAFADILLLALAAIQFVLFLLLVSVNVLGRLNLGGGRGDDRSPL